MKTKLTLNIDAEIIQDAKKFSKNRKQSISAIVEDYLKNIASVNDKRKTLQKESFTQRFRKAFPSAPAKEYDYKAERHKYLEKKYGRK